MRNDNSYLQFNWYRKRCNIHGERAILPKSAIEGSAFDQRMEYLEDQERKRGLYCYVEITPNIWYHNLKQSTG